ncbi:MAG: dihydrolipoamide acetyltransferase family protein [Proteobacteria bacterium]|nr:dihydrolipoamide acetyltransferase family protein [Pseudomonadota bacterium]
MPTNIYLVKVGMNMTDGIVEEWYIADGATVEKGQLLYRLETEKVNLDVDAELNGVVRHLVAEGVTMLPGDVIGYIYAPGEPIPDVLPESSGGSSAAAATVSTVSMPTTPSVTASDRTIKASPAARRLASERGIDLVTINGSGPGGRIVESDIPASESPAAGKAPPSSPIARKLARELNVDLNSVTGTGPGGRITKEDVESAASAPSKVKTAPTPAAVVRAAEDQQIPLRGMRKTIAKRMLDSLQTSAQLTMDMDVNMEDAIKLRAQLVDEWADLGVKPTYTDLVIRAVAKTLTKHPEINASMGSDHITRWSAINVGVAVSVAEGLLVPVIQNADTLSLLDLARESARLANAARAGSLTLDDMQNGTFTVSALGMYGVDSFTPIINSPEAGILGINRIRDDVRFQGEVAVRTQVMRLSLTWDHRILDGAPAAAFLAGIRDLLQAPFRLLV